MSNWVEREEKRNNKIEVSMPRERAQALMAQLAQSAPWAFLGYSTELANALQRDLTGFATAVDTRRRQFISKSEAAQSST